MTDNDTQTRVESAAFPFDAADDALRGVLDAAGPAIAGESPCPDWTGTDVLHHLIDTERSFMDKVGFDLGPAPTATEPIALWSEHADRLRPLLSRQDVLDTPYSTPMGESTVAGMMAMIYGFDLLVHRWDVARSAGHDTRFTDAELDAMEASIAKLADMLYSPGAFVEGVTAPPGADRQTRVLAVLGRKA
jgi:uncharacterized protein (TIGR03086 family)